MKLIALKHMHIADSDAKEQGKRYRQVKTGESFNASGSEAESLIRRGIAKEPDAKAEALARAAANDRADAEKKAEAAEKAKAKAAK